jgi:hypothetical protein
MPRCCPYHGQELLPIPGVDLVELLDGEPVEFRSRLCCPATGCSFRWDPSFEQRDDDIDEDDGLQPWSWPSSRTERCASGRMPGSGAGLVAGCTVVEEAVVSASGGGFENEWWRVRVNDDWLTISELLRRRSIGGVSATFVDGHGPDGMRSSGSLPPQTSFHRRTYVVAPVGTLFWKRVLRPLVDRKKTFSDYLLAGDLSVARGAVDDYFVLRGQERLVRFELDRDRRSPTKASAAGQVTGEKARRYTSALVAALDGSASPTSPRPRGP